MKAATLLAFCFAAFAAARPVESTLSHEAIVANSAAGLRLLRFSLDAPPQWYTEEAKLDFMRQEVKFVDVTETWETKMEIAATQGTVDHLSGARVSYPAPSHQTAVNALIPSLSTSRMNTTLATLTALNNRYYRASTGAQASTIIRDKVQSIITSTSRAADVSVALYTHSWTQSSIIAKVAGSVNNTAPMVIIGAHMDSINLSSPTSGRAPGADDDGSGTVTLIELVQVLLTAGWKPSVPVEFHWYSGEEAGLLGSDAIATAYKAKGALVKAFMELDMTAYFRPGTTEVIAIETDYIDSGLNSFTRQLISSYATIPAANDTPCGYACSDHASWYEQGYPTTMLFEAVTGNDNSVIHSSSDTITLSGFSWSHALQFARVALGFVYELSA
ncbi:Zn-dependent exopeptidase [Auriculariales sp. MPI-PUGE-AT-0066]|nr:Zn-dependent exopeptidase [Auriculariales sp. MPI-PUGE-AT-0066]